MIRFSSIKTSKNQKWIKKESQNLLKLSYYMDLFGDYKNSENTFLLADALFKNIKIAQPINDDSEDDEIPQISTENLTSYEEPEVKEELPVETDTTPFTEENLRQLQQATHLDQGLHVPEYHIMHTNSFSLSERGWNDIEILNKILKALADGGTDVKKSLQNTFPIWDEIESWGGDLFNFFDILRVAMTRYYKNPIFTLGLFNLSHYHYNKITDAFKNKNITDEVVGLIEGINRQKNIAVERYRKLYEKYQRIISEAGYEPDPKLIKILMGKDVEPFAGDIKRDLKYYVLGYKYTDFPGIVLEVGKKVLDYGEEYIQDFLESIGKTKFESLEDIEKASNLSITFPNTNNRLFVSQIYSEQYKPFIAKTLSILNKEGFKGLNSQGYKEKIFVNAEILNQVVELYTPEEFAHLILTTMPSSRNMALSQAVGLRVQDEYKEKNFEIIEKLFYLAKQNFVNLLTVPVLLIDAYKTRGEKGFDLITKHFNKNITFNQDARIYAPMDVFLDWLELHPEKIEFPTATISNFDVAYLKCPDQINSLNASELKMISKSYSDDGSVKLSSSGPAISCDDIIKFKQFGISTHILGDNKILSLISTETLQNLKSKYESNEQIEDFLDNRAYEILTFGDVNEDWKLVLKQGETDWQDFDRLKYATLELDKLGYTLVHPRNIEPRFIEKYGIFNAMIFALGPKYATLRTSTNETEIDNEIQKIEKAVQSIFKSKNYSNIIPYSMEFAKLTLLFYFNYNIRGRDAELLLDLTDNLANATVLEKTFPDIPSIAIENYFDTSDLTKVDVNSAKYQFITGQECKSKMYFIESKLSNYDDFYKLLVAMREQIMKSMFFESFQGSLDDVFSNVQNILDFIEEYGGDIEEFYAPYIAEKLQGKYFFYSPELFNYKLSKNDFLLKQNNFKYFFLNTIKNLNLDNHSFFDHPGRRSNQYILTHYEIESSKFAVEIFSNEEMFFKAFNLSGADSRPVKIKLPLQATNRYNGDAFKRQEFRSLTKIIQIFGNLTYQALDKFTREKMKSENKKPVNFNSLDDKEKSDIFHSFGNALPNIQNLGRIDGYPQYYLENFTIKNINSLIMIGDSWNKVIKFYDESTIRTVLAEMSVKDATKLPEYKKDPKLLKEKIALDNMAFLVEEINDPREFPFLREYAKYYSRADKDAMKENFLLVKRVFEEGLKNPLPEFASFDKSYELDNDTIRMRFLKRDDPIGMFLGNISECCQKPDGAARSAAFDGTFNENSAFMVIEINNELALMAYVWQDENGNVCFDNFETIGNRLFHSQKLQNVVKRLLMDFASSLPEGNRTTHGLGYTKLDFGFKLSRKPLVNKLNYTSNPKYEHMRDLLGWGFYYEDSEEQNEIPRHSNSAVNYEDIIPYSTDDEEDENIPIIMNWGDDDDYWN